MKTKMIVTAYQSPLSLTSYLKNYYSEYHLADMWPVSWSIFILAAVRTTKRETLQITDRECTLSSCSQQEIM